MSVKPLQSAERVLIVLEHLAEYQPIGVAALARLLDEDKSAVQRALVTLAAAGWIRPTGDEITRWELTTRALVVASNAQQRLDLARMARATLEALQQQTGETTLLAVPDAGRIVVVDVVESREMVRTAPHVGMVIPTDESAAGQAILAAMADDDRNTFLGAIPIKAVRAELTTARERGWSLNVRQPGATSVGAAIRDATGRPLGAIAISAIAERLPRRRHAHYGAMVARAAEALSARSA